MEAFPERMGFPGGLASIEFVILAAVYRGGSLWDWSCIGGFDDLSLAVSQSWPLSENRDRIEPEGWSVLPP